ncbi:hypothetical protein BROC_00560 [Candidatus Brocadiaceae bacterium]|nr:hypothetical protein BROC_00560 [Candidatus Brocadiaceae bacterium]
MWAENAMNLLPWHTIFFTQKVKDKSLPINRSQIMREKNWHLTYGDTDGF